MLDVFIMLRFYKRKGHKDAIIDVQNYIITKAKIL